MMIVAANLNPLPRIRFQVTSIAGSSALALGIMLPASRRRRITAVMRSTWATNICACIRTTWSLLLVRRVGIDASEPFKLRLRPGLGLSVVEGRRVV